MDCFMQDLVIDIGDIADHRDVIASCSKPTTQNIEVHTRSNMPDMWRGLNSGTADIDTDFAWNDGLKIF